jgi:hypothetical protein
MKTWLTVEKKSVYRHNEYGDEPDWIGTIEGGEGTKWFNMYGDNRRLTTKELRFLLNICSKP